MTLPLPLGFPSKCSSVFTAACLLLVSGILLAPKSTFAFSDLSPAHANAEAIEYVRSNGIVSGYPDGTYRPDTPINRAEFTKILVGASSFSADSGVQNCFPDVRDEWFASFVCAAKSNGIVGGHPDGTFHPGDNINTAEAAKIFVNTFGLATQEAEGPWYELYLAALQDAGALPDSAADPSHFVTRGEMAEMIWRIVAPSGVAEESASSSSAISQVAYTPLPFEFPMGEGWQDRWGLLTVDIPPMYRTTRTTKIEAASWYEEVSTENVEPRHDDEIFDTYFRIHIPKGSYDPVEAKQHHKPAGGVNLYATGNIEPTRRLYLQYYVRFPKNFDFTKTGILPSLGGGLAGSEYGVFGAGDFPTVLSWDSRGHLSMFISGRDRMAYASDPFPTDGEWHKIDLFLEVNTVDPIHLNGIIKLSMDDELLIYSERAGIRSGADDLVEGVAFNVIFGAARSLTSPSIDQYVDIAKVRIGQYPFSD